MQLLHALVCSYVFLFFFANLKLTAQLERHKSAFTTRKMKNFVIIIHLIFVMVAVVLVKQYPATPTVLHLALVQLMIIFFATMYTVIRVLVLSTMPGASARDLLLIVNFVKCHQLCQL